MRRIVIVGQRAIASPTFLLDDLAGTSGRLDVLLRSLRAALMVSHGLRRDAVAYLVLLGGAADAGPRALRFTGSEAKFLRPEERSLAVLVKKVLAVEPARDRFADVRPGIAMVAGGIDAVIDDLGPCARFVLEEGAPDVRHAAIAGDVALFVGDHLGFDEATRAAIARAGATPVGLGPVSVHAEDAIAIVSNELDRRGL